MLLTATWTDQDAKVVGLTWVEEETISGVTNTATPSLTETVDSESSPYGLNRANTTALMLPICQRSLLSCASE